MKTIRLISIFIVLILSTIKLDAKDSFKIYESALNKIINKIGNISGNTGTYTVYYEHPCLPDVWNTCKTVLGNGKIYWTMKDSYFDITSLGVKLKGKIDFNWSGLSFSSTFKSNVNIYYNSSDFVLNLSVSNVTVPIKFLGITLTTRTFRVPYSLTFPVSGSELRVGTFYGDRTQFLAYPVDIVITTHTNYIKITFETKFY